MYRLRDVAKGILIISVMVLVTGIGYAPTVYADCCCWCGDWAGKACPPGICGPNDSFGGRGKCNIFGCNCDGGCKPWPHDPASCVKRAEDAGSVCRTGCFLGGDKGSEVCEWACDRDMERAKAQCNNVSSPAACNEAAFDKFRSHDRDKDGHVDTHEFKEMTKGSDGKITDEHFHEMDKNKDGKITAAEAGITIPEKYQRKKPTR